MSATGFKTSWLNERFRYDNAARNQTVEQKMKAHFQNQSTLTLLDLGSGTGANLLYFLERLSQSQRWILVEQDPLLCQATIARLCQTADQNQWEYTVKDNQVHFTFGEKVVTVEVYSHSFFDLNSLLPEVSIDLVLAAAVFDLLSEEQFAGLLQLIFQRSSALLTTMNYEGMYFSPSIAADLPFLADYEAHMQRAQTFGHGMGKTCVQVLPAQMKALDVKVLAGESNWQLDPDAQAMHLHLLDFMKDSIPKMWQDNRPEVSFRQWLANKHLLSNQNQLRITVRHQDFFCWKE